MGVETLPIQQLMAWGARRARALELLHWSNYMPYNRVPAYSVLHIVRLYAPQGI